MKHARRAGNRASGRSPRGVAPRSAVPSWQEAAISLQRMAGNRAVAQLLLDPSGGAGPTVSRDWSGGSDPGAVDGQVWVTTEEYTGWRTPKAPDKAPEPAPEMSPEKQAAVEEGMALAENRARSFLNTSYSETQDAARDFTSSALTRIDGLSEAPSGYIALFKPISNGVMNAIGAKFPNDNALNVLTNVGSGVIAQAYDTSASANAARRGSASDAAKAVVVDSAQSSVNAVAAAFSSYRDLLRVRLADQARAQGRVQELLASSDPRSLDEVITRWLGLPDPDRAPFYAPVRTQMELPFEGWIEYQAARQSSRWAQPGDVSTAGRSSVGARVAEAVEKRSGRPGAGGTVLTDMLRLAGRALETGGVTLPPQLAALVNPPSPAEGPGQSEVPTFEPSDDPVELAVRRGMGMADTRAREYLNSIYNDVQDAVRDAVVNIEGEIDAMPGAPSGHWGLVSTVLDAVQKGSSVLFPQMRIGQNIKLALLTGLGATLQGAATTHVGDSRDAAKADCRAALRALANDVANKQSGIYSVARQEILPTLMAMAGGDEEVRTLLAGGSTEGVEAVVSLLGIPDPGKIKAYREVRMHMELPFHDWLQKQLRVAQGWTWMGDIRTDTERIKRQIEAAGRRRGDEATDQSSGGKPWGFPVEEIPEEAPGIDLALEDETAKDERILRNVALAQDRAQTYLNVHRDGAQDAVRDFTAFAQNEIGSLTNESADLVALITNTVGTVLSVAAVFFPPTTLIGVTLVGGYIGVNLVSQVSSVMKADSVEAKIAAGRALARAAGDQVSDACAARFRRAHQQIPAELMTLAFDEDSMARAAFDNGDPEALETLIVTELGIPNPDQASLYAKLLAALEERFVREFAELRSLGPEETEKAVERALTKVRASDQARRRRPGTGD